MYKTNDAMKEPLRKQYDAACNGWLVELLNMWELDARYGYWNSDAPGTIYHYGDTHNLSMEDIIYIVENDISENEVLEWEDYLIDARDFGFDLPNLRSWHMGCPYIPQNVFTRLRKLKANFEKAVEDEREGQEKNKLPRNPILDKRIDDCYLSVRTRNICKGNGLETIGDLVKIRPSDWLNFRNGGRKSLYELQDFLEQFGIKW